MKTRIVHTRVWRDVWYQKLSRDARELFLFCITNPYINLCGVYELNDDEVILYTKIENLARAKKELRPKVLFHKGWVYVPNASELSGYQGSKNAVARQHELEEIPYPIRRVFHIADTLSIEYQTPNDRPNKSEIINYKLINQKPETKGNSTDSVVSPSAGFSKITDRRKELGI